MDITEFMAAVADDASTEAHRRKAREERREAVGDELGAELDTHPIAAFRGRGRGRFAPGRPDEG